MNKKLIAGALYTSAFVVIVGCTMHLFAPDTVLFSSYNELCTLISDKKIQTEQQIIDFFSEDRAKGEELTFNSRRDVEDNAFSRYISPHLQVHSYRATLFASIPDELVDKLELFFDYGIGGDSSCQ